MMTWEKIIREEKQKPYYFKLSEFLKSEYKEKDIFPPKEDVFNCFKITPFDQVKVVIIGQDPYHQPNQAHGLAFSVLAGNKMPPSLRNIFNELQADLDIDHHHNTDLSNWAKQGVLLLNKVLTVEKSKPTSHANYGWEMFTDNIIKQLNKRDDVIVYVLWGGYAQMSKHLITNKNHYVIESSHPSPLSTYHSFNGSRPFSKINQILLSHNYKEIDWSL